MNAVSTKRRVSASASSRISSRDVDGGAVGAAQWRDGRPQQLVRGHGLLLLGLEALAPLAHLLVGQHAESRRHARRGLPRQCLDLPPARRAAIAAAPAHTSGGRDVVAGAEPEHAGERERGRVTAKWAGSRV